jgi:hypothetical protein
VGAGVFDDHADAAAVLRPNTRRYQPDTERQRVYDQVYEAVYRNLAASLSPVGQALNAIMVPAPDEPGGHRLTSDGLQDA